MGGARVVSGPPPKSASQRRRRNKDVPLSGLQGLTLPAAGRPGRAPAFPLPALTPAGDDNTDGALKALRKRELDIWRDLWRLPQAVAWEQLHVTHVVARYARTLALGEIDLKAAKEARALEDRLGLSPAAMRLLRWQIAAAEDPAPAAAAPTQRSARHRVRAVDPDAVART